MKVNVHNETNRDRRMFHGDTTAELFKACCYMWWTWQGSCIRLQVNDTVIRPIHYLLNSFPGWSVFCWPWPAHMCALCVVTWSDWRCLDTHIASTIRLGTCWKHQSYYSVAYWLPCTQHMLASIAKLICFHPQLCRDKEMFSCCRDCADQVPRISKRILSQQDRMRNVVSCPRMYNSCSQEDIVNFAGSGLPYTIHSAMSEKW